MKPGANQFVLKIINIHTLLFLNCAIKTTTTIDAEGQN